MGQNSPEFNPQSEPKPCPTQTAIPQTLETNCNMDLGKKEIKTSAKKNCTQIANIHEVGVWSPYVPHCCLCLECFAASLPDLSTPRSWSALTCLPLSASRSEGRAGATTAPYVRCTLRPYSRVLVSLQVASPPMLVSCIVALATALSWPAWN